MLRFILKKRNWGIFFLLSLPALMLTGCQGKDAAEHVADVEPSSEKAVEEEPRYVSEISKKDCLLCGDGEGTLLPLYKGEENIGVISLNTFDLAHVEINRYDDYGNLLKEPSQGISTRITSTGEDGFTFRTTEDTDRGYAMCDLYFNDDEFLNVEQASSYMCTECLNKAMDDGFGDDPTGMAVINFSTGEVRILRENLVAFQFGDFYVSCKAKRYETEENELEMSLLVFYCPKRYGD